MQLAVRRRALCVRLSVPKLSMTVELGNNGGLGVVFAKNSVQNAFMSLASPFQRESRRGSSRAGTVRPFLWAFCQTKRCPRLLDTVPGSSRESCLRAKKRPGGSCARHIWTTSHANFGRVSLPSKENLMLFYCSN